MVGKLSFSPKKVLNKTILFDVFDVILEPGTNSFYLRREDGK